MGSNPRFASSKDDLVVVNQKFSPKLGKVGFATFNENDSNGEKLKSCAANFFKRDSAADKNISRNVVSTKCRESFFPGVMTTRDFHPQLLGRRIDDDDTTVVDAMSPIVFAVTADNGTVGAATKSRPEQSPERQRAGKKLFPWHC